MLDRLFRQLRESERLSREYEERWQFAIEGAGEGVWDWDVSERRVFYSDGWKAMIGLGPDELEGTFGEWEELVHPDDLGRAQAALQSHLRGEAPEYESEFRMRCGDGSYKWVLARGKVIRRSPDGQPLRVIGISSDITLDDRENRIRVALRESRQQLAEANQVMAGVLEHTHVLAALLDLQFEFVWVNRAFAQTCRREPSELTGRSHFDLHPDPDTRAIFQKVVETGEPISPRRAPFSFPPKSAGAAATGTGVWSRSLRPTKGSLTSCSRWSTSC